MTDQDPRREAQRVTDNGPFGKYFHIMLNMADDELDPFQYRLLGHYKRMCGEQNRPCWEAIATTARKCKMPVSRARAARLALAVAGYINLVETAPGETWEVTLIDRMADNIAKYSSPGTKSTQPTLLPDSPLQKPAGDTPLQNSAGEGSQNQNHPPAENERGFNNQVFNNSVYNTRAREGRSERQLLFEVLAIQCFQANLSDPDSLRPIRQRINGTLGALLKVYPDLTSTELGRSLQYFQQQNPGAKMVKGRDAILTAIYDYRKVVPKAVQDRPRVVRYVTRLVNDQVQRIAVWSDGVEGERSDLPS